MAQPNTEAGLSSSALPWFGYLGIYLFLLYYINGLSKHRVLEGDNDRRQNSQGFFFHENCVETGSVVTGSVVTGSVVNGRNASIP